MARISGFLLFFLLLFFSSVAAAVTVSTVAELQNAVNSANRGGDKQIIVRSGTYNLNGVYLRITADSVRVSGQSGKPGDVILDGGYVTTEIFQILGSNVTIKDMTLKRAYDHPIHIFPGDKDVSGILIDNLEIYDPGQQAIKINQNAARTYSVVDGVIQNCRIELTDSGRAMVWQRNGSCYTGGVDGHHVLRLQVRDNVIVGFWCEGGLSEHGVHLWSFSEDTVVERNHIINCDRGIGFGLGSSGHVRGIIRNNMIYHDSGHTYSDVGIGLETAQNAQVYNNTIYHEHPYANGIEYRFTATSGGFIQNNLTNKAIASRNGGTATVANNVTSASANWFVNVAGGDLHLSDNIAGVVDSGGVIPGLRDDFDKGPRPVGSGVDIGCDERGSEGAVLPDPTVSTATVSSWLQLLLD